LRTTLWIALAAVLFTLTACGEREMERAGGEIDEVQLFEKGKGVRLPEEMRQVLGVETIEVTERAWPCRFERSARVYRAGDETKPASAVVMLDKGEAKELMPGQEVVLQGSTPRTTEILGKLARCEAQATVLDQVEALVEFPDAGRCFAVGSLLRAVFTLPQTNAAFVVPQSAVLRGVEGAFVYAVNGDHFTRTPVKVAGARDGSIGIIEGLYAGDVVVAKAADAMWMIELCALKGGTPCCPVPKKNSGRR